MLQLAQGRSCCKLCHDNVDGKATVAMAAVA
jgi:hypothetical protein